MNQQPPTTEELTHQSTDQQEYDFSLASGALPPFTPEELAWHEQDRERAAREDIARREATTRYLAEKKAQASVQLAKVVPIAMAPSYHTRKIEAAQSGKAQATPQEW